MTLYQVGEIKEIEEIRKYISLDGGMADNIRPALYGAKYRVVVNKADAPNEEVVTLCGKCCESGDILVKDVSLPKVESGDVVAICSTGAYGYSMASNYNKLLRPPVRVVKDGEDFIAVKRETYADMVKDEV